MKTNQRPQLVPIFLATGLVALSSVFGILSIQPVSAYWVTLCSSAKCKEAEAAEAAARELQAQASEQKDSYQAQVNNFNAQIAEIQAAINKNEEEISELNIRISNTQTKIDKLRESVKATVIKLYLNNNVSELEMIASAESFSDFQSKSNQQEVVQGKLKQLATDAKNTKAELESQKSQLEVKKQNNEARRAESEQLRAEQQEFVNEWAGKESAWSEAAKASEAAKIAAQESTWVNNQTSGGGGNVQPGDPNKGGYPYSYQCPGLLYNGIWQNDGLGMYKCQCVSYAAWKVEMTYHNMPYWGGRGNAYEWIGNSSGIPGAWGAPKAGSVGIRPSNGGGDVGHAFWVESVNGDGSINLSEYNYTAGDYSYRTGVYAGNFYYIYFGDW
jgi:peptidoglycan hydrolase CwlO-like protein/surface antigen